MWLLWFVFFGTVLASVFLLGWIWLDHQGLKARVEYAQLFPGRCYDCWLVRMGKAHGHLPRDAEPKDHDCCERRS